MNNEFRPSDLYGWGTYAFRGPTLIVGEGYMVPEKRGGVPGFCRFSQATDYRARFLCWAFCFIPGANIEPIVYTLQDRAHLDTAVQSQYERGQPWAEFHGRPDGSLVLQRGPGLYQG